MKPHHPSTYKVTYQALKNSLDQLKKFMVWAHFDLSEKKHVDYLISSMKEYHERKNYDMVLFSPDGSICYGFSGIRILSFHPMTEIAVIGYWTNQAYAGLGYATLSEKNINYISKPLFWFRAC